MSTVYGEHVLFAGTIQTTQQQPQHKRPNGHKQYAFFLMVLLLAKGAMAIMALLQMDAMLVDLQRYLERLWDDRQHEVMFWNQLQSTVRIVLVV